MSVRSATPARHVRRLHLRAANEDDARHAVTLLTDALHTASLPIADRGRLIAIRRLDLGRIPARATATALALHITRVAHEVMSGAVAFDLSGSGASDAVLFPDRGDALAALARRLARGAPADEWFWSTIVPAWEPALPPADRWRTLIDAAHDGPAAAPVAAAIVHEAVAAGAEDALLASIRPSSVAGWLRAEGWSGAGAGGPVSAQERIQLPRPELIARCQQRWGALDGRVVWLGTMLMVHAQPGLLTDPRLPARIRALLPDAGPAAPRIASETATVPLPAPVPGCEPAGDVRSRPAAAPEPEASPTLTRAEAGANEPGPIDSPGEFTSYAGLLFLVPMLQRLGLGEHMGLSPALARSDFGIRLLQHIGRRTGMTPDDPMASAIDRVGGDPPEIDGAEHLEWPEPVREILSRPRPRAALDSAADVWLAAVRRWSRRHARLGLVALIRRPGWVRQSRTHLEISFALDRLDVRLRRLALDVDPGWVPWMARVLRFHYRSIDERAH